MAGVWGFMDDVINMMKDARPEVADECAQQIRVSEWELARIGTRLNRAPLVSAITPTRAPAAPADPADGGFWLPRQTTSQLQTDIDVMSFPQSLPPSQVAAEVYGATMNRNPPSEAHAFSHHCQPGHSSSVASSRQRQVQEEQNQANRRVQMEQVCIDEEERNLEEQEATTAVNSAILAAKARSREARVRQELDHKRFEVGAVLSESLARIEDENVNDMGYAHGLDAAIIHNWVNGTHDNMAPEGGNTTPSVTNPSTSQPASGPDVMNLTEPVTTNVDPYTMPFGATTLPSSESPGNSDHNAVTSSYLTTTG
jgi:hypothetical protein